MRRIFLAAFLLAVLAAAPSAHAVPFVLDLPPGTHDIRVQVTHDGAVRAVPLPLVTVGGVPLPPPTNPPPVTTLSAEVGKLTKAAIAAGGTAETAARLSALYSVVADEIETGEVALSDAAKFLSDATDRVLSSRSDAAVWLAWRQGIGVQLTALRDGGKLSTRAHWDSALTEIGAAVRTSLGGTANRNFAAAVSGEAPGILDGINWEFILEIIKIIIELLKAFRPM